MPVFLCVERLLYYTVFPLSTVSVVQQAWCQQILVDLVHCLYMYFLTAETVVWRDVTSAGQSLSADNEAPVNRNISRTR